MSIEAFKTRLSDQLNLELELIIHENRWTMLNLLHKNRSYARLSVHKMFLEAPDSVILAIAHYVRGARPGPLLRHYIQSYLERSDYSHLLDQQKCLHQGDVYHLKSIYEDLNKKYFNNALDLSITWFGSLRKKKSRSRIIFGQYLAGLRLIKIHRMLDDPFFPEYFVAFVVYHEMLHSVVPGSLDGRGRYCFHSPAFKEQEKAFEQYQQAIAWEKTNKEKLFHYGWS